MRFEKRLPKPTSELKDYEKLKEMLNDRETATRAKNCWLEPANDSTSSNDEFSVQTMWYLKQIFLRFWNFRKDFGREKRFDMHKIHSQKF